MREIVLDTETTGLDPLRGDRLVEVGCVEIFNRMPTGQTFHRYINPEREMSVEALAVHGLSSQFLSDKPFFHEVVEDFLAFIDARYPQIPKDIIAKSELTAETKTKLNQALTEFNEIFEPSKPS